jgi:hypothetical protein
MAFNYKQVVEFAPSSLFHMPYYRAGLMDLMRSAGGGKDIDT